ncbi:hypothetical protein DITRI_Ditri08aG0077500 [Diplodiscus trichospermus]
MAIIPKLLFALLFLTLIGQGHCQCSLEQVSIIQTQTGKIVENQPEWKVVISNGCVCSLSELKISCRGFQTVEPIDPSILSKSGDECLINNGEPVAPLSDFTFNYAWDESFAFIALSSQPNCS